MVYRNRGCRFAPRLSYEESGNLATCFEIHENGGPRALWAAQYGNPGDKPETVDVEDCAIAFYVAYNAVHPGTF